MLPACRGYSDALPFEPTQAGCFLKLLQGLQGGALVAGLQALQSCRPAFGPAAPADTLVQWRDSAQGTIQTGYFEAPFEVPSEPTQAGYFLKLLQGLQGGALAAGLQVLQRCAATCFRACWACRHAGAVDSRPDSRPAALQHPRSVTADLQESIRPVWVQKPQSSRFLYRALGRAQSFTQPLGPAGPADTLLQRGCVKLGALPLHCARKDRRRVSLPSFAPPVPADSAGSGRSLARARFWTKSGRSHLRRKKWSSNENGWTALETRASGCRSIIST